MNQTKIKHKPDKYTQELTEILSLLHLALKNIQLYPPGHDLLQTRLKTAHQSLARVLLSEKRLVFGVARDTFTHGEVSIGADSSACTAFAKILTRHEIASITFSKGISQHSLFLFLKTVGILPEQRKTNENILQEISRLNIPHLHIELIDYNYFAGNVDEDSKSSPMTWMTFTQKLTSGVLGNTGEHNRPGSHSETIAPETLAAAINKQTRQHPETLQHFSALLDQLLKHSPQRDSSASFSGKELSRMISSLNPDLRQQFLDTTLRQCDKNIQTGNTEKILGSFSDSVVLDMLEQINEENTTVSPTLLNLIQKFSSIQYTPEKQSSSSITRQQKTTNLLKQENYAQEKSSAYQKNIQQLSEVSSPSASPPPDFPFYEHLESMEELQLNKKVIQATLIFMNNASKEKEYKALAGKLMEITLLLPDSGAFDLLQTVFKQLKKQATNNKSAARRAIANTCTQDFTAPDFLEYVFSILPDATTKEKQDAIDFMVLLGHPILDTLLKIYCMKAKVLEENPLVTVLKTFRMEALTRVFTLLPKTTSGNTLKLLTLIKYLGTQGTARLLHP